MINLNTEANRYIGRVYSNLDIARNIYEQVPERNMLIRYALSMFISKCEELIAYDNFYSSQR